MVGNQELALLIQAARILGAVIKVTYEERPFIEKGRILIDTVTVVSGLSCGRHSMAPISAAERLSALVPLRLEKREARSGGAYVAKFYNLIGEATLGYGKTAEDAAFSAMRTAKQSSSRHDRDAARTALAQAAMAMDVCDVYCVPPDGQAMRAVAFAQRQMWYGRDLGIVSYVLVLCMPSEADVVIGVPATGGPSKSAEYLADVVRVGRSDWAAEDVGSARARAMRECGLDSGMEV